MSTKFLFPALNSEQLRLCELPVQAVYFLKNN